MSVALLIPENWDIALLTRWAVHFTRAERADLLVMLVRRRPDKAIVAQLSPDFDPQTDPELASLLASLPDDFAWRVASPTQVANGAAEAEESTATGSEVVHQVRVVRIVNSQPTSDVLFHLNDVSLLIIPRHTSVKIGANDFEMERVLFRDAPCRTMQLRPGKDTGKTLQRILVPAANPDHSSLALELADSIVATNQGELTAFLVEPQVDEVAELVGQSILDGIVKRSLGRNPDRLIKKVVLSDNIPDGIRTESRAGYDLVLSSASYHGRVHRLLFHGVSEQLLTTVDSVPVAVLRRAMPFSSRLSRRLHSAATSIVPQLDRERRVAFVERIQSSSRWDFDFIALMCLSTLIAAMGLLQDSSAVVIGAMLVAPLMTPLMGAGLALVQGNRILLKSSLGSVLRGFLLAFAIGWLLGVTLRFLSPLTEVTTEMLNRGSPGVLDLFIALISGIAAAYATGRPNLLSALPGVAIAAALVPPIATSGLAVALSDPRLAGGAALLFFTNIVAIILGTAMALSLVGVRNTHEHGSFHKWSTWIAVLLVIVAVGLAVFESKTRIQVGLVRDVKKHLTEKSGFRLVEAYMNRRSNPPSLHLKVEGPRAADEALGAEVLEIARQNGLNDVRLELETQVTIVVGEPGS